MKRRMVMALLVLCMALALLPGMTVEAAAYADGDWSNGWTWWSQGQSKYNGMRGLGCYVVAKAKLLVDAGIETTDTSKFNPDILYEWEKANGYIDDGMNAQKHSEPSIYASRKGKTLTYEGIEYGNNHNKIWENINAGKYTILCLSTPDTHYVYVNNGGSKETGKIRVFDSWYTENIPGTLDLGNRTVSQIITFSVPNTPTPPSPPPSSIVASGNCGDKGDNLTWTLDDNGTLTIRGSGKMREWYSYDPLWHGKLSAIKTVVIENGVTSIGRYAFDECRNLTSATIPNSVTSIEARAFQDCKSLTGVVIPNGVTSIEDGTFRCCSSLTSVIIPNSVTLIESDAFDECRSLTSVTIPNSVTSIGYRAFEYCESLTSVTIPNGVTFIGGGAFGGCTSLTNITIPNSVTSVGDCTFYNCSSLTSVTIPNSVTSIERFAFDCCDKLSDVYYSGNQEQWEAISKGEYNAPLRKATIHCNTPIVLPGVTVNFNAHNGTVYTKKVTTGKTYGTLRTPTRSGYTFDGWYTAETGGTKVTSTTKVTATTNHTLHAHWTKNKYYTVTFNANGGTAYTKTKTVTGGKTYGTLPTPTRENYHFTGWYTTKSIGGKKVTSAAKVNLKAKQTLYARWSKSAVKASATKNGSWQVTLPRTSKVPLYTTSTTAAMRAAIETGTRSWVLSCTRRVTLSNGTTRYYTKVDNKPYWFTYSYEMKVK